MKACLPFVILSIFILFTPSFAGDIGPASQQQIDLIKQGFFEDVAVLKSASVNKYKDLYYVGLKFSAHGYESTGIGIWIVEGNRHIPSNVYSVNATASLFTGYVSANEKQLAVSMSDVQAKTILKYLKKE